MDNLVLTTVTRALDRSLSGAAVRDLQSDGKDRLRIRWEIGERSLTTLVSLRPEAPWIGSPSGPLERRSPSKTRFADELRSDFRGARLESVNKPTSDRWLVWRFADGRAWVLELALHGANLIQLDAKDRVVASLRLPRSARVRLERGAGYAPPTRPPSLPDPGVLSGAEIDAVLDVWSAQGESSFEGLRRHLFGVGTPAARLVCEEAASCGRSAGAVLADRWREVLEGRAEPVIECAQVTPEGPPEPELWPWEPARPPREGHAWQRGRDAAATAGLWYGRRERTLEHAARRRALGQILHREAVRCDQAARRCAADLERFEDPERHRLHGEALLAGLSRAERSGDTVRVPNPHELGGNDYVFRADPAVALPRIAGRLFGRHRRAVRGLRRTRERLEQLRKHGEELAELERLFEAEAAEDVLLAGMRRLRLPVALEPATRRGREAATGAAPRIEGVRVYHATSGEMILAGKGARDNHRLTFRLAAPHDFWFHASGLTGAHVILRNDPRARRPGRVSLEQAAAVAALHSEGARESWVEVNWTQRKNVRKPRGAAPGTVVLKRFETVRVRPGLPPETARKPTNVRLSKKT